MSVTETTTNTVIDEQIELLRQKNQRLAQFCGVEHEIAASREMRENALAISRLVEFSRAPRPN